MIPANKLAQAGRDYFCDTLYGFSPTENHVSRLVPSHIQACELCRDKIDKALIPEDLDLVNRVVNLSIAKALVDNSQEYVEVKIDPSITIPVEKTSEINAIVKHIIQKFVEPYQNA